MNREEVKRRVEDAGRTIMMLDGSGCRPAPYRSCWPEYARLFEDLVGAEKQNTPTRLRPNSEQIDDMEEVFGWLTVLAAHSKRKKMRYVARAVCYGMLHRPESGRRLYSWARLGRKLHANDKTVKSWYENGIEILAKIIDKS